MNILLYLVQMLTFQVFFINCIRFNFTTYTKKVKTTFLCFHSVSKLIDVHNLEYLNLI